MECQSKWKTWQTLISGTLGSTTTSSYTPEEGFTLRPPVLSLPHCGGMHGVEAENIR